MKPKYSGEKSAKFWDYLAGLDNTTLNIMAYALQDHETRVLQAIEEYEFRIKKVKSWQAEAKEPPIGMPTIEQLRSIEWLPSLLSYGDEHLCVVCGNTKSEGHYKKCWLDATLTIALEKENK
jgi:hypothetical protein